MKHLQKIRMLVLAFCMSFVTNMQAMNKWDGTIAAGFASGSGTSANPYIVSNEPEFAYMIQQIANGKNYSGQYIKQTKDLDITNETLLVSNTFSGDYNGNSCAIVMKSKLFDTVSGSVHNLRVYSENACPIMQTLGTYGYIYNIYRFSKKPFVSTASTALIANTNNGYIYNTFVDTYGNTGGDGQKAFSIALKNTGRIENCVNNITNDEWGRYDDYDNQSYMANENIGRISNCYSNGNVSVANTNGTIIYTHCYGWLPTGDYIGCTSEGDWDTVGRTPIYQSYVYSLNSWVSDNSYSRSYSTWKVGTIPLVDVVPDSYQVEYWDSYFGYTLTKNIKYGTAIGDMPIPQGNAQFIGWYYNGSTVTSSSVFDYGITLNAQWKWDIRTQPTSESMTIEVDDEEHALYQWKRYTKFTNFVDWKSDNQGVGGSISYKTYKFDALAGDTLQLFYSLSSEAYDKFNIKLNNVELLNIGGNQSDWFKFNIEAAGSYELVLSYKKDGSGNQGLDGVDVSNISVSNAVQNIEGATSKTLTQYELTGTNAYCCEVKYTNNTTVLTSNIVAVNAHSVLYYVNGELYHTDVVREGETFESADGPAANGYVFSGWEGLPEDMLMSTKDIVVNATFKPVADTDVTEIANTIYLNNCEASCGNIIELPIKMKNNVSATGFQFDLVLPGGITVAQDEDGLYEIELSTERTTAAKTNTFGSSLMSDGSIRVLAASTHNYAFTGNDGEVCVIKLNIGQDVLEGEYPIIIKNIEISDNKSQAYTQDYVKSTLTIISYISGDANGDNKITVTDFTAVANAILGNVPANYVAKAADVNSDGKVTVSDLTGIANIILYGSVNPSSNAKSRVGNTSYTPEVYVPAFCIEPNSTIEVPVYINNGTTSFSAYQMDINLPQGLAVSDIHIVEDRISNHILQGAIMEDGACRLLSYSTRGNEFMGNNGAVAVLTISADDIALGDYVGKVSEIELAKDGNPYYANSAQFNITVGDATGIMNINNGDGLQRTYNVSGVETNGMRKGINIIKYSDGTVKKSIVK